MRASLNALLLSLSLFRNHPVGLCTEDIHLGRPNWWEGSHAPDLLVFQESAQIDKKLRAAALEMLD